MAVIDLRQIPKNAGVGWSQAADFWRAPSSICPASMYFGWYYIGAGPLAIYIPWDSLWVNVSGTQLGTGCAVSNTCGSNPTYCTVYRSGGKKTGAIIDIWGALAAGLWSSSVAFTARMASPSTTATISAVGVTGCLGTVITNPARIDVTKSNYTTADVCTDAGCPTAVLTVYDDGTFTLA